MRIVQGDMVRHPDWPEMGVGKAAHIERGQRWVAWMEISGHWAASAYTPEDLVFVSSPSPVQPRLLIDGY